MILSEVNQSQ